MVEFERLGNDDTEDRVTRIAWICDSESRPDSHFFPPEASDAACVEALLLLQLARTTFECAIYDFPLVNLRFLDFSPR